MKKISVLWHSMSAAHSLDKVVSEFANKGEKDFLIVAPQKTKTYPDVCVPLAALMEWYKEEGITFTYSFPGVTNYVKHTCINAPLQAEEFMNLPDIKFPLDKVWKYNTAEGENALVTAFINAIRESTEIEKGVISSVEWCLNEIMDNVLQHSISGTGYVMGQVHKEKRRLSLCVFDMGVGIYGSLKKSKHCPNTPVDGLTMALQEKVTRDERVGQGNGMWGLKKIIDENGGNLLIESNTAVFSSINGEVQTKTTEKYNAGNYKNATLVDFQMDIARPIDIAKALNGHEPSDFWLENHEVDDKLYFFVQEDSVGTGTRIAAQKFKNKILNSFREERKKVVLDFQGINVVSSSYADELIGKIVAEKGFLYFLNYFELRNLSSFNMSVVNRSVEQRMAQKYYDASMPDVAD